MLRHGCMQAFLSFPQRLRKTWSSAHPVFSDKPLMKKLKFYIILCLLIFAQTGRAQPVMVQEDALISPDFAANVQFYLDKERRFDKDQRGLFEQTFQTSKRPERIDLGFSSGILWARFQVLQNFPSSRDLIFYFHHTDVSRIRLFEVRDGQLHEISRKGGGYSREQQSLQAMSPNVPALNVAPGLHEFVMAAEAADGRLNLSFSIAPDAIWIEQVLFAQYIGNGLFYGMILTLCLFHFFVFVNTGDRAYALYVCYIVSVLLLFFNLDGILDHLLPLPERGGWATLSSAFSGLLIVTIMLVNKAYFGSKKRFPRINLFFDFMLIAGSSVVLTTPFISQRILGQLVDGLAVLGIAVVFIASAYVWRQGYHPAKYVFISRLVFTSLAGVAMAHLYGFFPENVFVDNSLKIGCIADSLIMTYGLGIRMRTLQVEKDAAREGERQAAFKLNWFNTLVRVITHDLSTPVSVIIASADLELRRAQPSISLQKNLERIARASKQQSNLINHVRDMIAVASGKKELELKPVCLNTALEEAMASLSEMAEQKKIRMELKKPDRELYADADPTALVQTVLDNFLSNAIKFSEEGSVVRLVLQENADKVEIKIIDSGIGIPSDLVDHLFDPDHSTSRPGTAREVGTGFGLPLAKVYIEQFHGHVRVESNIEKQGDQPRGTCFTIVLPLLPTALKGAA